MASGKYCTRFRVRVVSPVFSTWLNCTPHMLSFVQAGTVARYKNQYSESFCPKHFNCPRSKLCCLELPTPDCAIVSIKREKL